MKVNTQERERIRARVSLVSRLRLRIGLVLAAITTFVVGSAAYAGAAVMTPPPDPTGGAGDDLFTSLTSYLQDHLIAAVLALAVIGIIVGMVLKWGKKAAKSV
jgi:hypothetical protein